MELGWRDEIHTIGDVDARDTGELDAGAKGVHGFWIKVKIKIKVKMKSRPKSGWN